MHATVQPRPPTAPPSRSPVIDQCPPFIRKSTPFSRRPTAATRQSPAFHDELPPFTRQRPGVRLSRGGSHAIADGCAADARACACSACPSDGTATPYHEAGDIQRSVHPIRRRTTTPRDDRPAHRGDCGLTERDRATETLDHVAAHATTHPHHPRSQSRPGLPPTDATPHARRDRGTGAPPRAHTGHRTPAAFAVPCVRAESPPLARDRRHPWQPLRRGGGQCAG